MYGADELLFPRFGGGLVLPGDLDPTEIGDDQASSALNVDFEAERLRKRLGRTPYNTALPSGGSVGQLRGAHRYYSRDGASKVFIIADDEQLSEDDGGGSFSAASGTSGGLTGGAPCDFWGWKERVYFGNGVDAVRRRLAAGSWETVALLTPPTTTQAPVPTLSTQVVEAFDSGTWTLSGGSALSTASYDTDKMREGTGCLALTASGSGAVGKYVHKAWGAAATVDLSAASFVSLWFRAEKIGITFAVGVKDNSGSIDFSLFPSFVARQANTWVHIRVPLDRIPPASRTASTGLGIQWQEKGSGSYNQTLYLDDARLEGPLVADRYEYFYTYAETSTVDGQEVITRESNPSPVGKIEVPADPAVLGVKVTLTASSETEVTMSRIYRYRLTGEFSRARLVGTAPKSTTQLDDATNVSATDTEFVVDSVVGWSAGCVFRIDSEDCLVTRVEPSTRSLFVTRAYGGSTAAIHNDNATITFQHFLDLRGDGDLAIEDAEELVSGQIAPPLARTYCVANNRVIAGHVYTGSTWYPWRLHLSRLGYPEQFGGDQEPDDPFAPGWLDLPTRDHIRRIVEFDGDVIVFCDRSIWTLSGSAWSGEDGFVLRQRASVGLDARGAVAAYGRSILFLADDGVRVLAPNRTQDGLFETWVVSEPVDSRVRAIDPIYRSVTVFGLDERSRLHVSYPPNNETVNRAALVFDLKARGALEPGRNPARRGWTEYSGWGFSCFLTLQRGGGDYGQLIGGGTTPRLYYLHQNDQGTDLETDGTTTLAEDLDDSETTVTVADGSQILFGQVIQVDSELMLCGAPIGNDVGVTRGYLGTTAAAHSNGATVTGAIAWYWQGKAIDAGPGRTLEYVYVGAEFDAQADAVVRATPVLNGAASSTTYSLALGSGSSGYAAPLTRCAASIRARFAALKLSGFHAVAMACRSARIGVYRR